jgi:hypothetical protein
VSKLPITDEFVKGYFQEVIDRITMNLSQMRDSRGHNRYGSGGTAQEVGAYNRQFLKKRGDTVEVTITMPGYWEFIDKGVRGAEWTKPNTMFSPFQFKQKRPPLSVIRTFMTNRGIVPRRVNGKRSDKGADGEKRRNQLAYLIAESIRKRGIESVPFYSSVVNSKMLIDLQQKLENTFGDDIFERFKLVIEKKL